MRDNDWMLLFPSPRTIGAAIEALEKFKSSKSMHSDMCFGADTLEEVTYPMDVLPNRAGFGIEAISLSDPEISTRTRHNMALFSRSIPSGGYFICAMPSDKVYILVFESPPENRFSPSFVDTFQSCLETIETSYPPGVLVTASRIPSSYCGDLPSIPDERQEHQAWQLLRRILTYPMPTIAFINGHAVGMGFLLALCHDFRIHNRPDTSLRICQGPSAVDLAPQLNLIRAISPCSTVVSSRIANGKPLYAREAIKRGLVNKIGHVDEIFKFIKDQELLRVPYALAYRESKIRSNRKALRVLDSIDGGTGLYDNDLAEAGPTNRERSREPKL